MPAEKSLKNVSSKKEVLLPKSVNIAAMVARKLSNDIPQSLVRLLCREDS
jgi:hypothetical protein